MGLRNVRVAYHWVREARGEIAFLADEVRAVFRNAGIELELTEGVDIPLDPRLDPFQDYSSLVKHLAKEERDEGHLIIGVDPPDSQREIAGELLDPETRGVVAAYTRSSFILQHGAIALLHTSVHEIGHMLNLAHEDITDKFISAMDSAGRRALDASTSWAAVTIEAREKRSEGLPDYFFDLAEPSRCYPFCHAARWRLNNSAEDRLQPWGGKFERAYSGLDDCLYSYWRSHAQMQEG